MQEKILIVEDELIVAGDIRSVLEKVGYRVCGIARSVNRALEIIDSEKPFLVLLDIYLQGNLTGMDLAIQLNERDIAFVYLSANCNQEVMEIAKQTQPYGFVVKPFRENDLLVTLDIARYRYQQNQQMKLQQDALSASKHFENSKKKNGSLVSKKTAVETIPSFDGIIGASTEMQKIFEFIQQVAPHNTSVLILGESGTGKEGIANAIHYHSPRKNKALVKVNCSALPLHLIESELFGHEKGSFTGAIEKRIGKFEKADGGTIFLDEIGDMPADVQVKLLRVLQEKEIERIGSNNPIKVDVRVVAATNKNLEKEIAEGRFRLDLFYRLHVFPIMVPPLRERTEDIPLLVTHFINYFNEKTEKSITGISDYLKQKLLTYSWPGNVRELQNMLERSVILEQGSLINDILLPDENLAAQEVADTSASVKTIEEMERNHIIAILKQCNYKVAGPGGAAEVLNLPPSTLSSKIKKLGIK
ncbi:MAG: sigma-54 dependent transcriptional regulator [Chitinophagaceae bacterium]